MVGVPRSQGCQPCRRRKKGCDLHHPTCGRCARQGLDCSYDNVRWTFVTQDPGPSNSTSTVPVRSRSSPNLTREASTSPPAGFSDRSLIRTGTELGVVSEFWDGFLPKAPSQSIVGVTAGNWVGVVRDLAAFEDSVKVCVSACAFAALGRARENNPLLQEGTRLYAKALRQTNQALQDPVRAKRDSTLACVKLLSMYESIRFDGSTRVSTQGQDWHKHIEGTCRIVELRGPEKHVAHHGHTLFEEARVSAIISGITLRRPNFFTDVAWYTIPWETKPRNLRDELYDIMIALPDVLSRQDILSQCLTSETYTHESLFAILTEAQTHLNRCLLLATSLRDWEQKALLTCCEEENPSRPSIDFTGPPTLLEFCQAFGFGFFHAVNFYWVACIILHSSVWIMKRNVLVAISIAERSLNLPALLQLPDTPAWVNPRTAASNIARNASHYFADEAGLWGPWVSTFPIGAALHYYSAIGGNDSTEMRDLRALLRRPKFGKTAGDFLRSMANTGDFKGDPSDRRQHTAIASSWYGTDILPPSQASEQGPGLVDSTS